MRRLLPLALVMAVLGGSGAARAQDLGPVANDSALSASGGWVVWSEMQPDGSWRLVGMHAGARVTLPAAPRRTPFDADVGSDAHGRAVVTYSRCATEPATPMGFAEPNGLPRRSLARGCGVRVLDLASGRERALNLRRPHGASDTTPSMWRGDVAFARMTPGQTIAQLALWHHRGGTLTRLAHGAVPGECLDIEGCKSTRRGEVQQLDYDGAGVAFVWDVLSPGVEGAGDAWELRVDDVRAGTTRAYDTGYESGACGARFPVSPTMVGRDVWFDDVRWSCEVPITSVVHGSNGLRGLLDTGVPVSWQIAVDGKTVYAIQGPRPATGTIGTPCLASGAPCRLVATPLPSLPAIRRPPHIV